MGWGRMFLLGDVGQQLDIQDAKRALNDMVDEINLLDGVSAEIKTSLRRLTRENHELRLYVALISRLLVEKGITTPDTFAEMARQVDASDGQLDGGYTGNLRPNG